jgi:hypothetical protein
VNALVNSISGLIAGSNRFASKSSVRAAAVRAFVVVTPADLPDRLAGLARIGGASGWF